MRLIDADRLLKNGIRGGGYNYNGLVYVPLKDVEQTIKDAPTFECCTALEDFLRNERSHASPDGDRCSQWVHEGREIHCQVCGFTPNYSLNGDNSKYCGSCGAKMK